MIIMLQDVVINPKYVVGAEIVEYSIQVVTTQGSYVVNYDDTEEGHKKMNEDLTHIKNAIINFNRFNGGC